jgi:hypothetical protein
MRSNTVTIALAVAGIIAGAHAGIAAVHSESTEVIPDTIAAQPEARAADETASDVTQAQAPAPVAEPAPATTQATATTDERTVRIPFTNLHVKVTHATFPSASQEFRDPLPSVVAYFDRRNANTVLTGAPGPVFPVSSGEFAQTLPSVVAYWDRIEEQRMAAARPAPAVAADAVASSGAPRSPVAGMSSATEGAIQNENATQATLLSGT